MAEIATPLHHPAADALCGPSAHVSRSALALRPRVDTAAISAWTLAFTLVSYLALRGGGYDVVIRSQAGIVVWWLVLLGSFVGLLPWRIGARAGVAIGLLAAFVVWTGLAIGWSESSEQSVIELGRLATYLGVLVLAISVQSRTAARHVINGLACALGLVTVLAVLSRLHPQAFPAQQHLQFLGPESARKLTYPFNYWNALADFAAMGVPLLLAVASGGRTTAGRALAAATLPLSAVCVYLTVSRGGVIALGVGLAVFILLVPRRLEVVATLLVSGVAAAILLQATAERDALTSGAGTHAALHQGTTLLWLCVLACLAVALLQVSIGLAARNLQRPAVLAPSRRTTARRALALGSVLLVAAIAVGVPAKLQHAWHDFKQPIGVVVPSTNNDLLSRLQAANGNSRYQYWQAALHAEETHPWRGIGPGTFQFWWAQHATASGFIRNAHSLYFETLAETGITGLALLGGLFLWFAAVAVRRALGEPPDLRLLLAGASASLVVFLFSAAVEWVWQFAAIAATALILGAVLVAGRSESAEPARRPGRSSGSRLPDLVSRAGATLAAVAALGAVLIPLAGQLAIRKSQAAAGQGHLAAALRDSVAAERIQPYSAAAHLQEALVLEAAGELGPAASAARVATTESPDDWTAWLTLARIDARRGATGAALVELRQTRKLNPKFSLFNAG